ncbi:MAG: protein kinase [bacterium]
MTKIRTRSILDGKYELVSKIKEGGLSVLYYGLDRALQKPVAIKKIHSNLLTDKTSVDRFVEEARNAAKLTHANIVQMYDLRRTEDGTFYSIMEFVDGLDLKSILTICKLLRRKLQLDLMVHIVAEVAKALDYAHNLKDIRSHKPLNILHGNIDPSNILISFKGEVKLIDFGPAKWKLSSSEVVDVKTRRDKWTYLSPEHILRGVALDRRSDIFSLGVIFYELLTGDRLFKREHAYDIMTEITSVDLDAGSLKEAEIPNALETILRKSLRKRRDERYQSARDLYQDLSQFLRSRQVWALDEKLRDFAQGLNQPAKEPDKKSVLQAKKERVASPEAASRAENAAQEVRSHSMIFQARPSQESITVIDVMRHTARSHKKAAIVGLISVLVLFLAFSALDFSYKWTRFGETLYSQLYPSSLIIESVPGGARVIWDGQPLPQETPVEIARIVTGTHHLMLSREGFEPAEKSVSVLRNGSLKVGNETIASGSAVLVRFKKEIRIDSAPQGATVYINRKKFPRPTPFSYKAEVGLPLTLFMKLSGYKPIPELTFTPLEQVPTIADEKHWSMMRLESSNNLYHLKGIFEQE